MNRITSRTYTGGTVATPAVTYCYDGNTSGACAGAPDPANCNLKLHLTMVSSSASTADYSCYDQFGMPTLSSQITSGTTYPFSYSYNMLSEIISETFPSGRTVSPTYDSAGRATGLSGTLQGSNTTYVSAGVYAPNGAVSSLTLGNNLGLANGFNTRFQPSSVALGGVWSTSLYYCGSHLSSCSTNNGNLQEQDFTSQGVSYVQSYAYDALNRISAVGEDANGTGDWSQTFQYDSFGNRAVNINSGTFGVGTVNAVWTATWTPTGTSQFNSNNQFVRGTGDQYDGAGNEISVASSSSSPGNNEVANTMSYDGENRMISANIGNTGAVNYTYDGDGRRVTKSAPPTVYAYDAAGNLTGEYSTTAPSATGTLYLTGDHLGSTRVVTSAANTLVNGVSPGAAGTVVKCYDYMPFGEDIPSGVGSRGSCYPSGLYPATPDVLSVKFTGKERDAESGLDFLEARYFSAAQGRFTSPDPLGASARVSEPQSWDRYSYVRNNPLIFRDPTGLDCIYTDSYSVTGTVGVQQGQCTQAGGSYVNGTIDTNSLTFNPRTNELGYSYSNTANGPDFIGTGVIGGVLPDFPGIQGATNTAGSAMIASEAGPVVNALGWGMLGLAGAEALPAAGTVVARGAATSVGWYYGATGGTGVVLGSYAQYPNYIDAAKAMGANAYNIPGGLWSVLNYFNQAWTANQAFLDVSMARGQQFYLSTPPVGATGAFASELQYLTSQGVGPSQWLMVPLPF